MSRIFKYVILACVVTVLALPVNAQRIDPADANEFFKHQNYTKALEQYKRLIRQEPGNTKYLHRAAQCILYGHMLKKPAVQLLEDAIKAGKVDNEVYFDLGLAYAYQLKFDKAIEQYEKYKTGGGETAKANLRIQAASNGKKLISNRANVTFENLGKNVNTPYPDYYPFVAKDESFIAFTSRRTGTTGGIMEFDGFYASDVYISHRNMQTGAWGKARNAGAFINSEYDEQCVGLSDDAKTMFVYQDKIKEFGDIFSSFRKKSSFGKMEKMGETVNTDKLETSASVSADGNTLFFASERPGGSGGIDLWMARKLPTGEWARAQNLGPNINTLFNEGFPTLADDGKTLYFCSEGHNSMGEYDIFKSTWDVEGNQWSKAKNLGYPINTPGDERVITFAEDGRHAYISALRNGSIGDFDIWRVTFNDVEPIQVVYMIKLMDPDGTNFATDAIVSVLDEFDNEIGRYSPNARTGKITIILPAGEFKMEIDAVGYKFKVEPLVITEIQAKMGMIPYDITLSK